MKQYTTPEQTAKLIELGFEKPKIDAGVTKWEGYEPICTGSYSIGELIEMLPDVVESEDSEYATIQLYFDAFNWVIEYTSVETTLYAVSAVELIDALFYMTVKLKEEGVI